MLILLKFIGFFTLLFLALEIAIRQFTGIGDIDNITENILLSLLFALLLFYATKPFKILLALFLLASLLIQASNAVFYGGWIEPINLYLLFENILEVANIVVQIDAAIILKSLLFSLLSILTIAYLFRLSFQQKGLMWVNLIIIIVLIFQPIRDGLLKPEKIEKRFTKDNHSLVRSFHNAYGVFFAMLLADSFGHDLYLSYRQTPHIHKPLEPVLTPDIYIYFGESLSAKYMGLYGYSKNTTPYLTQLIRSLPNKKLFGLSKKTIAGATATMPASVRFFHLLEQPDARKQAASFDTNLFQYAKKSGYTTTYISTQAEYYMNHIYKLIAGKYADNYLSSTHFDNKYGTRKDMDDALIIKKVDTLDLGKYAFSVLQPNGSHTPFAIRSQPAFKPFGVDSELAEYENSIFYTDYIINDLLHVIKKKSNRPWIFIITSDHGNYVDESHITRSIKYSESYTVPGIILTNNKQLYQSHIQPLEKCTYLFHQNISEMIARVLGFDVPVRDCNSGVLFTGLLNGMGAKSIFIEQGKAQMKAYTPINTHQESKNAQ